MLDLKEWVAVAALIISLVTVYHAWVKPGSVNVGVGHVIIHSMAADDNPNAPRRVKTFIVPMTITNDGARPTVVYEMALTLRHESDSEPRWLYFADLEVDETAYIQRGWKKEPDVAFLRSRLRPFVIRGHEVAQKAYLFGVVTDNPRFSGRDTGFPAGKYDLSLLFRTAPNGALTSVWHRSYSTSDASWNGAQGVSLMEYSSAVLNYSPTTARRLPMRLAWGIAATLLMAAALWAAMRSLR